MARENDPHAEEIAKLIISKLINRVNQIVVFPPIKNLPSIIKSVSRRREVVGDYVITVGGDGTILRTLLDLGFRETVVMGVGIGKRNFLASVTGGEVEEAVERLLRGEFIVRKLNRLEVKVNGETLPPVLNEVYFTSSDPGKSVELRVEVIADDEAKNIMQERMDGLIIATPTGSTAYSLSAGGPVVSEDLPSIILTPVCPYKYIPSLILPIERRIRVRLLNKDSLGVAILDGNLSRKVSTKMNVFIYKSNFPARLISFQKNSVFNLVKALRIRR